MADYTNLNVYRNCRFQIIIDGLDQDAAYFSEASGFDATYDVVEYRAGDDSRMTPIKFPGLIKYGNVTLKRGVTQNNAFFDWLEKCREGAIEKKETVTINLMDNEGEAPVATWEIRNVWVAKYTGPDFNGNASEVAMETVELAHEGIIRTT